MRKPLLFVVVAVLATPLALGACGGSGIPDDAVATIDGQAIKRSTFDHWMKIDVISATGEANPTSTNRPSGDGLDPPAFTRCIAGRRSALPPPDVGERVSDATLRRQCAEQYAGLKREVMDFLIAVTWRYREAAKEGVVVTPAELKRAIDAFKERKGVTGAAYEKFLFANGLNHADVVFQQRAALIGDKLSARIERANSGVTEAQVADYYKAHNATLGLPEFRDLRVVVTESKARAEQAKAALDSGRSWDSVVGRYSVDPVTRSRNGVIRNAREIDLAKALGAAAFASDEGARGGPVKTLRGWYVFEVTRITPAGQGSLAQSAAVVRAQLWVKNRENAVNAFWDKFAKRWKALTDCRDGFTTDNCSS